MREEDRLKVTENLVLRKIFGPTRDEATGEWRRPNDEELYDLYSARNIIRLVKSRIKLAGHVAGVGQEKCIQGFGGENWGKETTRKT